MNGNILIFLGFLIFSSCGGSSSNEKEDVSPQNAIITLNFNENIKSLNPFDAKTSSEIFVRKLVYDKVLDRHSKSGFESKLIRKIDYDSSRFIYTFELQKNIAIDEENEFDTSDVLSLLQSLFSSRYSKPQILPFFEAIYGYNPSANVNDLPSGIRIQGSHHFSIKLSQPTAGFLGYLSNDAFFVSNDLKGSGDFIVTDLNDDISCSLNRKASSKLTNNITGVELRFIKNKDEEINEFLKQNIDLIVFNPNKHSSETYHQKLLEVVNAKYPDYQVNRSVESSFKYAKIYNVADSATLLTFLSSLPFERSYTGYFKTNLPLLGTPSSALDSADLKDARVFNYQAKASDIPDSLSFLVDYRELNVDKIDRNDPFFVLNETLIPNYRGDLKDALQYIYKMEFTRDGNKNQWAIVLLSESSTYYISHFEVSGVKDYMSLSEIVKSAEIKIPSTY